MPTKIKSKKGMGAEALIAIALVLVSFVIIAWAIREFIAKAEPKEAEILCQGSISLRARTMITAEGTFLKAELKPVPVLCKTIDKKISGNREKIKEQIAEAIARCWWMFGEGKYEELLTGSNVKFIPALFGLENLKNKCFNCYTLLIDQDEIEGGPISAFELTNYLMTTNYPKLKDTTYLEYIQSSGGPGRMVYLVADEETKNVEGIKGRFAYSVSIAPKLPPVEKGRALWGAGKIAGALGTAVIIGGIVSGPPGWFLLGGTVVLGGITYSGWNDIMSAIYGERDLSSIYFSTLKRGEQMCGSGDIAGQ